MPVTRLAAAFDPRSSREVWICVCLLGCWSGGCAPAAPLSSHSAPATTSAAPPGPRRGDTNDSGIPADAAAIRASDGGSPLEVIAGPPARALDPRLLDPPDTDQTAPERFTALLRTSAGELTIDVRRSWAPRAADRFYTLVKLGFFDGVSFHRVMSTLAQFGISAEPRLARIWRTRTFLADPVLQTNNRGMVSFAREPAGRSTQLIINLADNGALDQLGLAPFGRVRELDVAQRLYAGYGDSAPTGRGPSPNRVEREGRAYLQSQYPKLDSIEHASVIDEKPSR
jgi:peptidyl-prolyl cis-trans isomerase A (cyclophilin A)